MKYVKKKLTWLVALCMFFSVFTGMMPVRIQAVEKSLGITIDGKSGEWQTLVSEGKAQKVGEGSVHHFGTVTTTSGALYLAQDEAYLYYYAEAQVPQWRDWGMVLDLALYVEDQEGGLAEPSWNRSYRYNMSDLPQYHLMIQNKNEAEVAQYKLYHQNKEVSSFEGDASARINEGYEGRIKLTDLGITASTTVYALAVITGNEDGHTAFNAIPESSENRLATDYSANPPNTVGVYAEAFPVTLEAPVEKPEYTSPIVRESAITFNYFNGDLTADSSVYVVGDFNNWAPADSHYEMTYNEQTKLYEIEVDKDLFKTGHNAYKFNLKRNSNEKVEWVKDEKCNNTVGDNNSVLLNQLLVPSMPQVVRGSEVVLPQQTQFYNEQTQHIEQVDVGYSLLEEVPGLKLEGNVLTAAQDTVATEVSMQISYETYEQRFTLKIVDEVFDPDNYTSPEVKGDQVTFRYYADGDISKVRVAGDFNGWGSSQDFLKQNEKGIWEITLPLSYGPHEYKFIIGENDWKLDPKNPENRNGNSLVTVAGLVVTGNVQDVQKAAETKLVTIGTIYDDKGQMHQEIPLTYEVVGESKAQIIQREKDSFLSIPEDFVGDTVTLKVTGVLENQVYECVLSFNVVSEMYTYTINYLRPKQDYEGWNLWLWQDGMGGIMQPFTTEAVFTISDDSEALTGEYTFKQANYQITKPKLNFITRKSITGNDWAEQDKDRFIQASADAKEVEVWIVQGDDKVYYDSNEINLSAKVANAFADSETEILVTLNKDIEIMNHPYVIDKSGNRLEAQATKVDSKLYKVTVADKLDPTKLYEVGCEGFKKGTVKMRKILDQYYYEDDDLGLTYSTSQSLFKVWAPTATAVSLCLYEDAATSDEAYKIEYQMDKAAQGVWTCKVDENLEGQYYMYKVTFADGTSNYAVDPYARSTSANGEKTAILNLDATDPEGWAFDTKPELMSMADSIVYELHVRDFSMDESVPFQNRGKFKAFTETNLKTAGSHKAGIDHLEELGVTHVHLLPSYDFAEVDETRVDDEGYTGRKFNWGYDPQNYNVPEGAYATDVMDPQVRIREFKEMVAALHEKDIRVVMDVVYNHTFSIEEGPFNKIVPDYYYRTHDSGQYANGSGCGNEVASERPMVRKYIKDSVKYWASEYNIDGFRFDLMGLIDTTTMEELTNELRAEVDPSIMVYGEPWQAGGSVLPGSEQTLKGSQKGKGFSIFNDEIRGAIKGGSDDASKGFATGATGQEANVVEGVKGAINTISAAPTEVITYVTAHDNLNLWDKVITTQAKEEGEGFIKIKNGEMVDGSSVEAAVEAATTHHEVNPEDVFANETVRRSLLANGMVLTSQGIPFIHAGDEVLRSKYGDHNSYRSPDAVNQIRWDLKDQFKPVFDYYQGLIALRKTHPAFRMETAVDVNKDLNVFKQEDQVVAFMLKDYANGDKWKNIVVIYNANEHTQTVTLPHEADWKVVVNADKAGILPLNTLTKAQSIEVPALSMMVLYDSANEYEAMPTTLELSHTKVGMEVGGRTVVKATVKDQFGAVMSGQPIIWGAENPDIVEVNKGTLIAKAEGETFITVSCGTLEEEVQVHVVKELIPTTIKIIPSKEFVYEGMSIQLKAEVEDQFGQVMNGQVVSWKSDTPELASIQKDGKVTGIQVGTARFTAIAGQVSITLSLPVKPYEKRYVVLEYNRDQGDYQDWNVWVWNTGVKEDQINFTKDRDGKKVAYIEVAPETRRIGFIIRRGNWLEKDVEVDRFIDIKEDQVITKVKIESGQVDFETLEPSTMPVIHPQEGHIVFNYRDNTLFKEGKMDTLSSVQVEINGQLYDMIYNEGQERFEYTYSPLEEGQYAYSYHVTDAAGNKREVLDAYNTVVEKGKSLLVYKKLDIEIEAEAMPYCIDYNDNSVISLIVTGDREQIQTMSIDLSSVGGESIEVDKDLMAVTIAVRENTPSGIKTLPITLTDKMNNLYTSSVEIEVKNRIYENEEDFDWDEAVIYFMLTDRFKNGDTSNDDPYGIGYDKNDPGSYHGGDFKGVTEQLDYLKDLGINTIWVSPIVENIGYDVRFDQSPYMNAYYGYHGYWAKDFERLNPHLGTLEEFHTLIDEAHARGMKIMVDVVINHAGYGMDKAIDNPPPHYPTDEDRAKLEGMIRTSESSDEVTGQLSGLPDFVTENPEVRDQIIDWQVAWVETLGRTAKGNTIDYFRVDTVKHVEDDTWMAFKNALTRVKPDFKLIGEVWGANADNDLGYLSTGMMDALLDFEFKNIAKQFVTGKLEETSRKLEERNGKLNHTAVLGNFLSSHDEEGFLYTLGGNEDLFKVAVSLQATAKGQPIIYYGEELGYSGANNYPMYDNRPDIDWSRADEKNTLLTHYKKMLSIRKDYSKVFAKGNRQTLAGSDAEGYTAFVRSHQGENVVVALNVGESKTCSIPVPFEVGKEIVDLYSGKAYTVDSEGMLNMTLPGAAEGGTAVLALHQVESPDEEPDDEGQSSSGGSGASQLAQNEGIEQITYKEIETLIKKAKEDKTDIYIKSNQQGVSLGIESYHLLQETGKHIRVDLGEVLFTLTPQMLDREVLKDAQRIVISYQELEAALDQVSLEWMQISTGKEISVSLVDKYGKQTKVQALNKPIQVAFKLSKKEVKEVKDARKVGVYKVSNKGAYRGGILNDVTICFNTKEMGKYVVYEYHKVFEDITQTHWAKDAIEVLASRHLIRGVEEDLFMPNAILTKAEFATILGRLIGAQENKENVDFDPASPITREEMAYMIAQTYAYMKETSIEEVVKLKKADFLDEEEISDWAKEAVYFNKQLGIIEGNPDGTFAPQSYATRAQMAQMMLRLLNSAHTNS